jgi:hypothetical protein
MVRGDGPELVVGGIRSDPAEEDADLPLPAFEVSAQDRRLIVVGDFDRCEVLAPPTDQQAALSSGAEVAHPLRYAPWGDQVARVFQRQEV